MPEAHVLVVEDSDDIRHLVTALLDRAGLSVTEAAGGREALREFYDVRPDLVVLDIGLPDMEGWEVLDRLRELSDAPVLMLTAQGAELDKVRALRAGADDYVTKPFGRQELLARVEALLRRRRGRADREEASLLAAGPIALDLRAHEARIDGELLDLTALEFRLLSALVRHAGQVLSAEQLLELVWNDPLGGRRDRVKIYVGYLRRKLAQAGAGDLIETVRGVGYRCRAGRP
jgi:DNA-binding response OmpR family regulator